MKFTQRGLASLWVGLACCLSCVAPAWAAVSVTIGRNFTGTTLNVNNYQGIPPDPNGAVGPRFFVEFINGTYTLYNKTNSNSIRIADTKFWANAGVNLASSDTLSDPRIVYDPTVQRWFASEIDFDGQAAANGLDPTLEANDFLVAVSATSDPTSNPGTWHGFLFVADPDTGDFADFPTLGVDSNVVYLAGDMYHGDTSELGSTLVSIPKADLLAASPTVANRTWHGILDLDARGQVLQPLNCFDGSASGKILAPTDIGNDSFPHSNLVCSTVLNGGGPGATLSSATIIPTAWWEVPDNGNVGAPSFAPIQPDGSDTLQANEARFSAKIPAVGGVLYAVQNTYLNGHIAIRWYRVRAADNVLLESGTIADPDLDLFFPSIAVNPSGVVMLAFNGCGPTTFISVYAMAGQTVDGVTTFGDRVLLQSGSVNYHDLYESLGLTDTSRWGDYSATSVDPIDPNRFWTVQMYPSGEDPFFGAGVWSTQITELITSAPSSSAISLALARGNNNLTLSWPVTSSAFQLQSVSSLVIPVGWTNYTAQNPVTNGSIVSVTVPSSLGQQFFRLKQL